MDRGDPFIRWTGGFHLINASDQIIPSLSRLGSGVVDIYKTRDALWPRYETRDFPSVSTIVIYQHSGVLGMMDRCGKIRLHGLPRRCT